MTHCPRCQSLLPEPPERYCPNCGADLEMAPTMPPPPVPPPPPPPGLPATAWAPAGGEREGTPWERRDRIGFAAALVETTQQVLTAPTAFFRAMPVAGGIAAPLLYALILGYAAIVVSAIYDFVLTSVTGSTFGSFGGGSEAVDRMMPYVQGGFGLGLKLVLGPVLFVVMLFLITGIVHLGLMMVGGAARGFEATFRVACYSEAAAVFHVIPICGQVLGFVYMLVLMVIGLSEAHGTSRGKAAFAVLLPIALCCCCVFVPLIGFVMSLASQVK